MEWIVLGAGAILPQPGLGAAGHLLRRAAGEPATLFDCGPGTLRSLAERGVALGDVSRVVLSHFHPDHWLDLAALAFARRNPAFDAPPLELIGPRGLGRLLERLAALGGERGWLAFAQASVHEVDPAGGTLERDALHLRWAPTFHTPEALAWRAELDGRALTYTGDSGPEPGVAALASGAELLVAECSFPDERAVAQHLTPTSAGELARAAGVARLLLTHFYPGTDPLAARARAAEVSGCPVDCARDGTIVLMT